MLSGFLWGVSLGLGYFWLARPSSKRVGSYTDEEIAEEYVESVTGSPRRSEWLGPGYTFKKKSKYVSTVDSRKKNLENQRRFLERHKNTPEYKAKRKVIAKRYYDKTKPPPRAAPDPERRLQLQRRRAAKYRATHKKSYSPEMLEKQRGYTAKWRAKKK